MSTYTTPAQDAATIRAELKRRGWGSRDISVRAESFSMGSAVNVTIRRPGIPFDQVEQLARDVAEHIRRDERTGDILGGGNRFVDVKLDEDRLREIRAALLPRIEAWPVGGGRPFVAGAILFHECERGPDAYAVSFEGDRLRRCWDANAAADWIARRLFRFPDALAIAQHVGQVQP